MKKIALVLLLLGVCFCSCKTFTQVTQGVRLNPVSNENALQSGTYFIVSNNLALTPLDASPGQNVFLRPFNRSGMQAWNVIKSGTGKNISYSIKLAGEVDDLWFQGYAVKDHTPIVGSRSGTVSYKIAAVTGQPTYWYIKSIRYNGDAMHSYLFSKELPMEIRFDPAEEGPKYFWQFEAVKE